MTSTIGPRASLLPSRRGFTLVELLVVFLILSFFILIAVPNFRGGYEALQTRSTISELQKRIRFAQYRAVLGRKRYFMKYEKEKNSYAFLEETKQKGRSSWRPLPGIWGKEKKIPAPMILLFTGKEKIFFFPDGTVTQTDIKLMKASRTLAVLHLGRSLRGAEIEWKEGSYAR